MDKSILTACDQNLEDLLPWWIENTRKFCSSIPIHIIDIGLSDPMISMIKSHGVKITKLEPQENLYAWFNKPWCLELTESDKTLWLDVDCQIVKSIDDIWDLSPKSNTIGLCPDPVMRRQGKEHDYTLNSGVMLYENLESGFIGRWKKEIITLDYRGDQEALRGLIQWNKVMRTEMLELYELPQIYNWLRLMYMRNEDHHDKRVIHWTGQTGKNILRDKIMPNFFDETRGNSGTTTLGHSWSPEGYERESSEDQ